MIQKMSKLLEHDPLSRNITVKLTCAGPHFHTCHFAPSWLSLIKLLIVQEEKSQRKRNITVKHEEFGLFYSSNSNDIVLERHVCISVKIIFIFTIENKEQQINDKLNRRNHSDRQKRLFKALYFIQYAYGEIPHSV